jgi:hypothetical protein
MPGNAMNRMGTSFLPHPVFLFLETTMADDPNATYATYTADGTQHYVCLLCPVPPGHEATDLDLFTQHMNQRHAGTMTEGALPDERRPMTPAAAPHASEEPLTIEPDEEVQPGEDLPEDLPPPTPTPPQPPAPEPDAPNSEEFPEDERE